MLDRPASAPTAQTPAERSLAERFAVGEITEIDDDTCAARTAEVREAGVHIAHIDRSGPPAKQGEDGSCGGIRARRWRSASR
jgi:hypothetical protein